MSVEPELSSQQLLWEYLRPYSIPMGFPRHSIIYAPAQPATTFYLVQHGQVSLQLLAANGRVLTLQLVEAGQLFGHAALTSNQQYDTVAEALRPVQVLAIPRTELELALDQHPVLSLHLLHVIGDYRLMIGRRLDEVAFKSVSARLASLLLEMAGAVAGAVADEEGPLQLPRRTHQQLAEMVNAYRETVTKVMNQFRAADLLAIDRSSITLLDPSALREVAQGC